MKLDANVILLIDIELNIGAYLFVDVARDSINNNKESAQMSAQMF